MSLRKIDNHCAKLYYKAVIFNKRLRVALEYVNEVLNNESNDFKFKLIGSQYEIPIQRLGDAHFFSVMAIASTMLEKMSLQLKAHTQIYRRQCYSQLQNLDAIVC